MAEIDNIEDVHKTNFKIYENLDGYVKYIRQKNQTFSIIAHLNIRSMRKNWDELKEVMLKENDIDVMVLTEINIKEQENIVYSMEGYKSVIYNRENKTRGGGIGIYIKEGIEFSNILMGYSVEGMFEYVQICLELDNNFINIISIYRPPDGEINAFVKEIEKRLVEFKEKSNVLYIGDINIDLNDLNGIKVNNYKNVLAQNGLENCIFANTREVMRDNKLTVSCIDHIFERYQAEVHSAVIQIQLSDHYMVAISFKAPNQKGKIKKSKIMYNENNLRKEVLQLEWDSVKENTDAMEIYEQLCSKFNMVYERNMESKCKPEKIRINKSWVTKEIIEKIRIRDKAYRKWKSTPTNVNYKDEYRMIRNKVNKDIKLQKNKYQTNRIDNYKDNINKMWREINYIVGRTTPGNIDDLINTFLGNIFKTEQILEAFVDEFSKGIERVIHICPLLLLHDEEEIDKRNISNVSIFMPNIKETDVESIIVNMKTKKAPGIDSIRVQDLKLCKNKIVPVLVKLINVSIRDGVLPEKLKTSIIRPIYKGGTHSDYRNYRPIAILSSIEKIMEKYITNKLNKYLEKHKIINEDQHGFQKGKSTVTLLKNFTDYVNSNLNTNKVIITIFIDLKKAFDTINHTILIKRLKNIGIRGKILEWFKNYLKQRTMLVRINGKDSVTRVINRGIPQGSILGPVLYTIYVNQVFDYMEYCKMYMYADDTAMTVVHNDINVAMKFMQKDFNTFQLWIHDNELVINEKKTKIMCTKTPKKKRMVDINIQCHSHTCLHNGAYRDTCKCPFLEEVDNIKYLGIQLDNKFSWDAHVGIVVKKTKSMCSPIL